MSPIGESDPELLFVIFGFALILPLHITALHASLCLPGTRARGGAVPNDECIGGLGNFEGKESRGSRARMSRDTVFG